MRANRQPEPRKENEQDHLRSFRYCAGTGHPSRQLEIVRIRQLLERGYCMASLIPFTASS